MAELTTENSQKTPSQSSENKIRSEALTDQTVQQPRFRTDRLTSEELRSIPEVMSFRWMMGLLGMAYLALGIVTFFYPVELLALLNIGPNVFNISVAMPAPEESFFRIQTSGLLLVFAFLSWSSARKPENTGAALIQIFTHLLLAAAYAYTLIQAPAEKAFFAYYVAIGTSAVMTLVLTIGIVRSGGKVRRARRRKLLHGNIWGHS